MARPAERWLLYGNDYDKSFEIKMAGKLRTFDSFECAIHALATTCAHCNCRIVGHGMEAGGQFYCCAHCASQGERAVSAIVNDHDFMGAGEVPKTLIPLIPAEAISLQSLSGSAQTLGARNSPNSRKTVSPVRESR